MRRPSNGSVIRRGRNFSNNRVATALKFLANLALKNKLGDAKGKFLTGKLKLTHEEVAEAFTRVSRRACCRTVRKTSGTVLFSTSKGPISAI